MNYIISLVIMFVAMPVLAQGLNATTQQYGPAPEIQQQYDQRYQQQPQYQQPQQYYQQPYQQSGQQGPQQYYQQQVPQQQTTGYPRNFIQQYTQTCMQQPVKTPIPLPGDLKQAHCACMADGVMRKVSYGDYLVMDQVRTEQDLQRVPQRVMTAFQNVASACFVSTGAKMFFGR